MFPIPPRSRTCEAETSATAARYLDEHFYQQRRDFMKKHQFFFALLIAMSVSPLVAQKAQGEVPGRRIEVTAKRFSFAPAEITVKKGEPVDLVLKSVDVAHGVRFRELQGGGR